MKRALLFVLALLVTPALPGVAGAHVDVSPNAAPAGKTVNLKFQIGHGCDGQATTGLDVLVPGDVADFAARSVPGWKAQNLPEKMVWKGGPLPDHDLQELPFTAKFYGKKGDELAFRVIQKCENGATTAWIQKAPASGVAPETPAPVVTLTSSAQAPVADPAPAETDPGAPGETAENVDDLAETTADDSSEDDDRDTGLLIPAIIVGLVISGGVAFLIYRSVKKAG
ncbi:MAG: YcnI family protein [Solirubrobacterales bacterium]